VKHSFIILISFLLLSPFLTSCEKYVGEYKDGKRNGQGTYTFPNRTKGIGYFRVNKPWNVTKYYKELNILGKYVNGKWIKNY
jgi:hypothetical protein